MSLAGTTPVSTHSTTSTTVNLGNPARSSSGRSLCAGKRVSLPPDVAAGIIILNNYHNNTDCVVSCARCTNQKMCVSPGKYYDAFCQIEIMGVVWIQPKIIE